MFFVIKKFNKTIMDFSEEAVKVLQTCSANLFGFSSK